MEREKGFEPSTLALAKPGSDSYVGTRSRTATQARVSTQGSPDACVHADPPSTPVRTPFVTRLLPDSAPPDRLLTVRDVARALSVSTATVYRLVHEGQLPHVRVLNAIRLRSDDLRALVPTVGSASAAPRR